jgi:uncharacterized protein YbjT (DUF2867 family)
VRWPYLDVATAPIDERDIATVGVRALLEDGHHKAEYVITGPQSLTQREQIAIIGEAIGRELQMEDLSPEEARRIQVMPGPILNILLNAWGAAVGLAAHVTSTFEEVTGRLPRSFPDWARDHAEEFQS